MLLLLLLLLLSLSLLTQVITAPYHRSASTAARPKALSCNSATNHAGRSLDKYILINLVIFKIQFRLASRRSFLYLNKVIILLYFLYEKIFFGSTECSIYVCTLP